MVELSVEAKRQAVLEKTAKAALNGSEQDVLAALQELDGAYGGSELGALKDLVAAFTKENVKKAAAKVAEDNVNLEQDAAKLQQDKEKLQQDKEKLQDAKTVAVDAKIVAETPATTVAIDKPAAPSISVAEVPNAGAAGIAASGPSTATAATVDATIVTPAADGTPAVAAKIQAAEAAASAGTETIPSTLLAQQTGGAVVGKFTANAVDKKAGEISGAMAV